MNQRLHLHLSPDQIYPFDARGIAKRFRHAAIFGARFGRWHHPSCPIVRPRRPLS